MDRGTDDAFDSDADTITGQTVTTTLNPGESDLTWDAGLYQATSIGDFVWLDTNANGIQDTGETGVSGVTVRLYRPGFGSDGIAGTPDDAASIASMPTNSSGAYLFSSLIPGDYYVEFVLPAGYTFSPADQGANDAVDSDANPATGRTINTTLVSNESDLTWDAGLYKVASLGDFVWLDTNANGIQDTGETGVSGVTVNLYRPGFGPDGIAGTPDDAASIANMPTNSSGAYLFTDLIPGDYSVEFILPTGYIFSLADQGANDALDSDANTTTGRTINTTLISGENDLTWDAGLYEAASLGDFVWLDVNGNGIQDGTETGIGGVTVNLYRPGFGPDGVAGTPDDTVSVASMPTNPSGAYLFANLIPGDYIVEFMSPAGYTFSPADRGADDALDSDANLVTGRTINTTLISGEKDLTWDAGLYQAASIGNLVWLDTNANGIQDTGETGVNGVTVRLYRPGFGPDGVAGTPDDAVSVANMPTNASGAYLFANLIPGDYFVEFVPPAGYTFSPADQGGDDTVDSDANITTGRTINTTLVSNESDLTWDAGLYQVTSIGDFVWLDTNANGIQDTGETGVSGVIVRLYRPGFGPDGIAGTPDDAASIANMPTNPGGAYLFANLIPGDYFVEFVLPAGYTFSLADQGANDAADSDANPTTGRTINTTLVSNESDLTWDAGLYKTTSLGDFVWLDTNANGIQDKGETGIEAVTVNLYRPGFGPDGVAGTPDDAAKVTSTPTAADGSYLFANLIPGDYSVEFVPPTGYLFSPIDQGSDDAVDSDADTTTGRTINTTLVSGESDLTWDAGLYLAASLGNFVWLDSNVNGLQDSGEKGVNGVTVNLYRPGYGLDGIAGTPDDADKVSTTTTNPSGLYVFTGLIPGNYSVEMVPPSGYTLSPADRGSNDAIDSDANPATGRTVTTTLVSGENDLSWDAGLNHLAALGNFVWNDADANGIQDTGEVGIDGVTVNLYRPGYGLDGIPGNADDSIAVATTSTAGGGLYSFTALKPGDYAVEFVPPTGYVISPIDQGGSDALDSDVNPITNRTIVTHLVAGETDLTWDAGLNNQQAALGNFVWFDINNNGLQDAGEKGVANVSVSLYTSTGTLVTTTLTGSDGSYGFSTAPGDYYVVFMPPSGYVFSPANQGSNDSIDSDADVITGQTATTNLTGGENDLTWDAGLNLLAKIGIAKRVVGKPVLVSPGTWDVTYEILVQNYGTVALNNIQVIDDLAATFPAPTTFAVQSLSSTTLTVNWPGYTGITTKANLLTGADTLNVGGSGTLTLVVRVVPTSVGPYNNTAIATGQDSFGNETSDRSDDGTTPDGDGNGDPSNDSDPTPVPFGTNLFDPPFGIKTVDNSGLPALHWTMAWINDTNIVAIAARVNDPIPEGLSYSASGKSSGYPVPSSAPTGSSNLGVACKYDPTSKSTSTTLCYYEGPTSAFPRGRIIWQGQLGPDLGVKSADNAVNDIDITFSGTVDNGITQIKNIASIDSDLNGDGDAEDTNEHTTATCQASWQIKVSHTPNDKTRLELPATGFAPDITSIVPPQPEGLAYRQYTAAALSLEIPSLGIKQDIVGVPEDQNSWNVSWLDQNVGYLDGTAFPTWNGNSVLTGHVYLSNGLPGPFVNLSKLAWGDQIIVHAFGQAFTYEVRSVNTITPDDVSVLGHKDKPWITLITCKEYDPATGKYKARTAVQAVLLKVTDETGKPSGR
jgi:LPXTG-site transpeptidase (sortase) family protein